MTQNLKIEGIYDQRTLKLLKSKGVRDFGFNFSPKSFNFIQERVFLNELIPLLDPKDKIHLHFSKINDPMIQKVIHDLKKAGIDKDNIYFDCDEGTEKSNEIGINYFLNYSPDVNHTACEGSEFCGFIFNFSFFEDLHTRGILNNFIANFYTYFKKYLIEDKLIILRIDWNDNVFPSLFDYFDIDLMSFSINDKIEVCYRNVDLNKLSVEMELIEKNKNLVDNF